MADATLCSPVRVPRGGINGRAVRNLAHCGKSASAHSGTMRLTVTITPSLGLSVRTQWLTRPDNAGPMARHVWRWCWLNSITHQRSRTCCCRILCQMLSKNGHGVPPSDATDGNLEFGTHFALSTPSRSHICSPKGILIYRAILVPYTYTCTCIMYYSRSLAISNSLAQAVIVSYLVRRSTFAPLSLHALVRRRARPPGALPRLSNTDP